MSPRSLSILIGALTLADHASAANVLANSLASGPGGSPPARQVVLSTGQAMPTNSLIRVGFFNNASANMAVLAGNDFNEIDALFVPLGEDALSTDDGTTGPIRTNPTGTFGGAIQNVSNTYMPAGNPLWIWAMNSTNPDGSATEWAIFQDPTWLMPSGIGSINLQTWQIGDPSEVIRGALVGDTEIRTAVIPEPATFGLLGLAVGLLWRRRR